MMLLAAFFLGLISSLHCVAMCGPIAMMLPVARQNPEKKALQIIVYHLGRLVSYGALGFVFGLFGRGLYLAGIQQQLSIVAGLTIIVMVVFPKKYFAGQGLSRPVFSFVSTVKSSMGSQLKKKSFPSFFLIGLLNGLLPCAMVYSAIFGALAMQDVFMGTAFMALFGLGTVPMMAGMTYLYSLITLPVRNKIQKIIPYTMSIIGVLFILRGLSLDIAHISPSAMNLFVQAQPHCR